MTAAAIPTLAIPVVWRSPIGRTEDFEDLAEHGGRAEKFVEHL